MWVRVWVMWGDAFRRECRGAVAVVYDLFKIW